MRGGGDKDVRRPTRVRGSSSSVAVHHGRAGRGPPRAVSGCAPPEKRTVRRRRQAHRHRLGTGLERRRPERRDPSGTERQQAHLFGQSGLTINIQMPGEHPLGGPLSGSKRSLGPVRPEPCSTPWAQTLLDPWRGAPSSVTCSGRAPERPMHSRSAKSWPSHSLSSLPTSPHHDGTADRSTGNHAPGLVSPPVRSAPPKNRTSMGSPAAGPSDERSPSRPKRWMSVALPGVPCRAAAPLRLPNQRGTNPSTRRCTARARRGGGTRSLRRGQGTACIG